MGFEFKFNGGLLPGAKIFNSLPNVITLSRVEGTNSIAVRVYLPRTQMNNLLTMLSALSRTGVLTGFTYVLLDPMTIRTQTFSYEFYQNNTGWQYDNMGYFEELRKVSSAFDKEEGIPVTFQSAPVLSFQ